MRQAEWKLLGMAGPEHATHATAGAKDKRAEAITKALKHSEQRRQLQEQYEQQYQAALVNIKQKLLDVEGPDLRENMSDRIRKWFISCRDQVRAHACIMTHRHLTYRRRASFRRTLTRRRAAPR